LIYPIAFPAAVCLVAASVASSRFSSSPREQSQGRNAIVLATSCAVVSLLAFVWFRASGSATSTALFAVRTPMQMIESSWHAFLSLAPLLLLAAPAVIKGARERHVTVLGLTLTIVLLVGAYCAFRVRIAEYKYLLYARFCIAILLGVTANELCRSWRGGRWLLANSILLVFGALSVAHGLRPKGTPVALYFAPEIPETSFQISLADDHPDARWTHALRSATPADTVLVARGLPYHAGPFVARSLYFPADRNPTVSAGYGLTSGGYLVLRRGYSHETFARRMRVVGTLFHGENEAGYAEALRDLLKLRRPIAIHFARPPAPSLSWLREQGIGRLAFADEGSFVWFIDPGAIPEGF
jgi:hypothetical protein